MDKVIETERLYFRKFESSDGNLLFTLDKEWKVVQYVGGVPLDSIQLAEEILENIINQYRENGVGRWCVIDKSTDQFIGWAGLKLEKAQINGHSEYYDLGYRFKEEFWGKGYATECALAIIEYAFYHLMITEVYAMAHCENASSQHVLEKSGFTKENKFNIDNVDHYWYSIKKEK